MYHQVSRFKLCLKWLKGMCVRWIWIPLYAEIWIPPIPHNDPPPGPPPWLEGEGIPRELARDLQVLATIDALAGVLSERHRDSVRKLIEEQLRTLELPDDMRVFAEPMPGRSSA
ncbi:hypothetical protein JI752_007055 [Lysobacter sp. MMG2]|uniref:hypothetical protein n=1 Tax=Lysobacter sp. MMG2 TaxID=2801338 RepID=UPI001C2268DE|nr:hypothetical protein [Lysobacter sp. MMG2]MBU8975899.1 hypothetical protein [Lysobacter sp. MMG2]